MKRFFLKSCLLLVCLLFLGIKGLVNADSPLTPTVEPPAETQLALTLMAAQEHIPPERLQVVNAHWQEYPDLGKKYWLVKALDGSGDRHIYSILVDPDTKQTVDLTEVEEAQRLARQSRYGKLTPELYERLKTAAPEEELEVAIWLAAPDREALLTQLAAQHPSLQAIDASGAPLNERDPSFTAQVEADYKLLAQQAHLARQRPVADMLEASGYQATTYPNLPSLSARIPAKVIHDIARQDEVVAIYLLEGKFTPFLASALPSNRGDLVQQRGISGDDVLVGVIDTSSVENNDYIRVSEAQNPDFINDPHATMVASVIVSMHPTYRGIAPGAEIATAPITEQASFPNKLDWFLSKDVRIINGSVGIADNTVCSG